MPKTLAEKVYEAHVVRSAAGEPDLLYIDLHLVHEVTSPQAFDGLRAAGRTVRRPDLTMATEDHNVPTLDILAPIADPVSRAQIEALIARATPAGPGTPTNGTLTPPGCTVAGTWDCEDWGNTFTDQGGIDPNLWRNAGALQHYQVAFGYGAADCERKGRAFPCYGPTDPVSHAQTIAFITRAMIAKGYWQPQLNAPLPYAGVPGVLATEVRTFHHYTGGIPAAPSSAAAWNGGATRGWFARALWQALGSYWGTDGQLPDGRDAGGYAR